MNLRHAAGNSPGSSAREAVDIGALFRAGREASRGEVAIGRDKEEAVQPAVCKRSMASIPGRCPTRLSCRVKRIAGMDRSHISGRISAHGLSRWPRSSHRSTAARLAKLSDFLEKPQGDAWRRVVSIDEKANRQSVFVRHVRHLGEHWIVGPNPDDMHTLIVAFSEGLNASAARRARRPYRHAMLDQGPLWRTGLRTPVSSRGNGIVEPC